MGVNTSDGAGCAAQKGANVSLWLTSKWTCFSKLIVMLCVGTQNENTLAAVLQHPQVVSAKIHHTILEMTTTSLLT